jgi:hypothetical protein
MNYIKNDRAIRIDNIFKKYRTIIPKWILSDEKIHNIAERKANNEAWAGFP